MRFRILALIIPVILAACSVEKKAAKAFNNGEYQKSITLYKKAVGSSSTSGRANYFIGESYRLSNRIKESEVYYAKAAPGKAGRNKTIDKDTVQLYYAQSLRANAKYSEAKKELEELASNTTINGLRDRARAEIKGLDYVSTLSEKSSYYKVKNLELLNTDASEYNPVFLNNELYFTSSRSKDKVYLATGTPFTDIYKVSSRGANIDMATVAALPDGINSNSINDGCITFSPDGKMMIFAKGNSGKKKGGDDVDLYMARYRNNIWTEPVLINVNQGRYWDSTPAFSPDGRTLYFSSNRPGGYGGLDIYSAQMDTRGRFSKAKNLGPEINTPGNETFPYVAEDAKLYFSSDEHPGFGELDMFVVKRANGKTTIENLGQPMNSSGDDFGIFLFRPDRGFFTSNREDGKGDDDIYTFVNEDPNLKVVNYYLQGITYTRDKDGNLEVLANTKVSLLDEKNELMQDFVTGNDGKFLFRVYENEGYNMVGELDGFLTKRQTYTTNGRSVDPVTLKELITNITLDTLLVLDKIVKDKIFALDNIYYNYNKSDIREDAAKELDKLVQLLADNPGIKIELGSHTDSVDDNSYNLQLSQRRAESAVRYIVQHGIAPDRLVAKGYGEEIPIARNTNPDGTDNPVGRQRNRRTEFKILEINAVPKTLETDDSFDEDKYFKDGNN
ncbi:MAG: OmpA family protein [Chryseolinea sp.]